MTAPSIVDVVPDGNSDSVLDAASASRFFARYRDLTPGGFDASTVGCKDAKAILGGLHHEYSVARARQKLAALNT